MPQSDQTPTLETVSFRGREWVFEISDGPRLRRVDTGTDLRLQSVSTLAAKAGVVPAVVERWVAEGRIEVVEFLGKRYIAGNGRYHSVEVKAKGSYGKDETAPSGKTIRGTLTLDANAFDGPTN